MSASQTATILWALGRFGHRPADVHLAAMTGRLQQRMATADGTALSLALWGLAAMAASERGSSAGVSEPAAAVAAAGATKAGAAGAAVEGVPLRVTTPSALPPPPAWMQQWYDRAQAVLPSFTAPCVANSLWALAELSDTAVGLYDRRPPPAPASVPARAAPPPPLQPPPPPALVEALLRQSTVLLPTFTPKELSVLVASLARLRHDALSAEAAALLADALAARLPAMHNDDYGLTIWGLARLGVPLPPAWLAQFAEEARRKLYSLGGDALGLTLWGLAQYG